MTDAELCAEYAKLANVTGWPIHVQATEDLGGIISNREMVMREAINLALWQKHVREWLASHCEAMDYQESTDGLWCAVIHTKSGNLVETDWLHFDAANFAAVRAVAKENI